MFIQFSNEKIEEYKEIFKNYNKKFNSLIENKENIKALFNDNKYFCNFVLDHINIIDEHNNFDYAILNMRLTYNDLKYIYDNKFVENLESELSIINFKYDLSFKNFTEYYFQKLFYVILSDEELTNFLIKKYKAYLIEIDLEECDDDYE